MLIMIPCVSEMDGCRPAATGIGIGGPHPFPPFMLFAKKKIQKKIQQYSFFFLP